jgi:thioesterase domain-containing protein/acyl carrier protein
MDGVEQLVIAFEVDRTASKNLDIDEVVGAIRNVVAEHYELPVYAIVLLKRGSIPKTSSGKIQRQACRKAFLDSSLNSLAMWTLKNSSNQQEITSENPLEAQLIQIWQRVLGISSISTKDNFFELGGDSLKAAVVTAEVEQVFGRTISLANLAEASTIEKLANFISQENREVKTRSLLPIKPVGSKRPFFDIHGLGGHSFAPTLARYLHPERPVYGLQSVGLDGEQTPYTRMEEMVPHYIQEIQIVQPKGPYLLGGLCMGGNIAFEMAQQLREQGQQVLLVLMMDSPNPFWTKEERIESENLLSNYKLNRREELIANGFSLQQIENIFRVQDANHQLITNHTPHTYSGRVVYFSASEKITLEDELITQRLRCRFDPKQPDGWNRLVVDGIEIDTVPGSHMNFFKEPHIQFFAQKLDAYLESVDAI